MANFGDKSLTSSIKLYCGDCLQVMNDIPAESDVGLMVLQRGRAVKVFDKEVT